MEDNMRLAIINALKSATHRFIGGPDIGYDRQRVARDMEHYEEQLAEYGMSWDEIEAIEIEVMSVS